TRFSRDWSSDVCSSDLKDFITGHVHGQHIPGHQVVTLAGRPFPFFVQIYLGALKSWMLLPAFRIFGSTVAVLRSTNLFWELIARSEERRVGKECSVRVW